MTSEGVGTSSCTFLPYPAPEIDRVGGLNNVQEKPCLFLFLLVSVAPQDKETYI